MEWRLRRPDAPGWYWLHVDNQIEVVKVFEYTVKLGDPSELEVARAGYHFTNPVSDARFRRALWAGPITPPAADRPVLALVARRP